jgi:glycosyltransferase involved in cell wall biosynthesis
VAFVCRAAVDEGGALVAVQTRWIKALAGHEAVERVEVITPRLGRADLPSNVRVQPPFGSGRTGSFAVQRIRFVLRFYRAVFSALQAGVDCFFISQGGPYPLMLLPVKLITRKPVYQWKAHPERSLRTQVQSRWCVDLIFTSTPSSFPLALDKVRVVGQGIDTDLFRPGDGEPERSLVVVGRIAPSKRIHVLLDLLGTHREKFGWSPPLVLVGPCLPEHRSYQRGLEEQARRLGIGDQVTFTGPREHHQLPDILRRHWATVNLASTAFDKASAEAMAVGLPIVTTNPRTVEIIPDELRSSLVAEEHEDSRTLDLLHEMCSWNLDRRAEVGAALRRNIVLHHGLHDFFDKILTEILTHLRRPPALGGSISGVVGGG